MIPSTTTFADAVNGNGRSFRAKMIHDGGEVSCSFIEIKLTKGACDGETFSVGSVFSSSAEIVVSGLTEALENEDITLQIGVLNANDVYEYIDYAQYTVIKTKKSASMATLTAVGFISSKLNILIPDISGTPTIQAVATAISNASGVSVSFVGITGTSNTLAKGITGMTCRGALEIITFLVGGFATENNSGGIEIHKYAIPQTPIVFPEGRSLTEPVTADDAFNMTGVKVIVGEEYTITADTTVDDDKTYYTRSGSGTASDPYVYTEVEEPTGNPHAQGYYEITEKSYSYGSPIRQTYQSEYMTSGAFNVFATNVVGYMFMPATVDMSLGDPRLEPWDVFSVTDANEDTYIVPCHLLQSYFDGGFSVIAASIGESVTDTAVEGSVTKQVGEMVGQLAVAQQAAAQAKSAASAAKRSADEAEYLAGQAYDLADGLADAVESAQEDARQAKESADSAYTSAVSASSSANTALDQLSVVEDIVGVLDLLTKNGDYQRSLDTEAIPDKWYFTRSGSGTSADPYTYTVQPSPAFEYVLTSDTAIVTGKPYYTRTGTGTEADPYVYTPVDNPVVADIGTYYENTGWNYFELVGIDSAIQNYVSSHLALDEQGLNLKNGNTRVLLSATEGLKLYDSDGYQVAQYGTDAVVGNPFGFHITITPNYDNTGEPRLSFYTDQTTEVAYISGQRLYITQSVVLQQMDVGTPIADGGLGQWSWKVHTVDNANNLYLKWLG